jgi:hypothetical protein
VSGKLKSLFAQGRVDRRMSEIAGVPLSRVAPVGKASVISHLQAITLVTAPEQWAYSAEAKFDVPGIESESRILKIGLEVESGVLGVGWLQEDQADWVTRASATPESSQKELILVLPAQTRGGKLVFDNWTAGGKPARGVIRSITIVENSQGLQPSRKPASPSQKINYNWSPRLAPQIASTSVLAQDPFSLIDVGCSGGINPIWRVFEPNLSAIGFDPQVSECLRLERVERNPRVHYYPAFVGLSSEHSFSIARQQFGPGIPYFQPFGRSSFCRPRRHLGSPALAKEVSSGAMNHDVHHRSNNSHQESFTHERIGIDEFVRQERITNLDFLKVDTDGSDLEVLYSAEKALKDLMVLGVLTEFSFSAEPNETTNCFSNIDHFMRKRGFILYDMEVYRYSRAALPQKFLMPRESATVSGQIFQGDALYLRDGSAVDFTDVVGASLSLSKKIKLVCLYEMFGLSDCAAELILFHEEDISAVFDTERALDALTPPIDGRQFDYGTYIEIFDTARERFLP